MGEKGQWFLYTMPVAFPKGEKLSAKAIRYGYKESEEVSL
jgi:hypothetical protein